VKEKYLQINNFKIRQSICKIRVSAHPLNIETGRYKNIIRSERKCTNCSEGDIVAEKNVTKNVHICSMCIETN
jgi:ribosomal protein S27AE